jgi:DNA (cytosine-5)-methyltransferase 1
MSTLKAYWLKKIGNHRGAPRIWLDMPRLAEAGLAPGARFDLDVVPHGIRIRASDTGVRCVSAKTLKSGVQLPIIDINSKESLSTFDGHGHVRVIVRADAVYVLLLASELAVLERATRLKTKLANGQPLEVASLSHGVGVLSFAAHEGLSDSGLRCELATFNEIHEGYAAQSVLANPASAAAVPLCAPMQELIQDNWILDKLPKVEVMELGLPCSGASIAGKSKLGLAKMEDHRHVGHLVHAALVLIARLQPAALVLENVEEYAKSASAQLMRHQLADMGYRIEEFVLRARDFGALENRVRWALVALSDGVPSLGSIEPNEASGKPANALGDLLDAVPLDSPSWSPMNYLRDKEARDRAAGKGFAMQVVTPASTSVPTIRKQYNKGGSTDPYVQHPERPELLRKFTPAEHARIKGVPATLVADMSATAAHEALGQGVVVAPFRALFQRLGECLQRAKAPDFTLRPVWALDDGAATG